MSDDHSPSSGQPPEAGPASLTEEAEAILAILGELRGTVSSPVIRECLETARSDIAHICAIAYLAAADDRPTASTAEDEAA
jgi:hypothetical protein